MSRLLPQADLDQLNQDMRRVHQLASRYVVPPAAKSESSSDTSVNAEACSLQSRGVYVPPSIPGSDVSLIPIHRRRATSWPGRRDPIYYRTYVDPRALSPTRASVVDGMELQRLREEMVCYVREWYTRLVWQVEQDYMMRGQPLHAQSTDGDASAHTLVAGPSGTNSRPQTAGPSGTSSRAHTAMTTTSSHLALHATPYTSPARKEPMSMSQADPDAMEVDEDVHMHMDGHDTSRKFVC